MSPSAAGSTPSSPTRSTTSPPSPTSSSPSRSPTTPLTSSSPAPSTSSRSSAPPPPPPASPTATTRPTPPRCSAPPASPTATFSSPPPRRPAPGSRGSSSASPSPTPPPPRWPFTERSECVIRAAALGIQGDERVPYEEVGIEAKFGDGTVDLEATLEVLGVRACLEGTGKGIIVGLHTVEANHLGEEEEGFAVEAVGNVAPNHDVEEDGGLDVCVVEDAAGARGFAAGGVGAHDLNLDGGVGGKTAVDEAGVEVTEGREGARGLAFIEDADQGGGVVDEVWPVVGGGSEEEVWKGDGDDRWVPERRDQWVEGGSHQRRRATRFPSHEDSFQALGFEPRCMPTTAVLAYLPDQST